ncbi:MAG: glutaredoxin family protein [Desulfovibrionaceae bacterium]
MADTIEFYGLSTCVHCKKALQYLEECKIACDPIFVDKLEGEIRKETISRVKEHNPAVSFPTLVINGKVVVGFNKDKIDDALGR